jgi:glutamate synthase domain-containing protein 2/glutamate synthase domain-containing protein 1/glutamate synthase domain-containing protein 3
MDNDNQRQQPGWEGLAFRQANAAGFPAAQGVYDPSCEHDSCGVGMLAHLDAQPRHSLVLQAIEVLVNLEHRGALGGDRATGDGAGLLLQLPDAFFRAGAGLAFTLPAAGEYGVGMVFLPTAAAVAARCREELAKAAAAHGLLVLGWRDVPYDDRSLGVLSKSTMPRFAQFFVGRGSVPAAQFEAKLYVVRRQAERAATGWAEVDASQFYVSSLSSRTIVYKGMLTGTQIQTFYPDLSHPDFASAFAVVHQRYSTNTLPTWSLAQPIRYLAHNGEINTLRGNVNRMKAREAGLASPALGADVERLKPVIVETGSDSAMLDNAVELLAAGGRSLPHAMMMLVPEAWGARIHMSADKRAFYEYHCAFQEPWDGPAALVFCDGRYIGGTLDRNGLRPCRCTVTRDGFVVLASESGVLNIPAANILYRSRLQAGRMFLVDLAENRIVPDHEIKAKLSRSQPYRHWVKENQIELRGMLSPAELPPESPEAVRAKQHAFGYSQEELRMVVGPMAANGQEAIGSMGNDAPLAVLSDKPQLLFHYFKQLFAQVTNPPIDPLREELVMSLMSYIGRERNLLAETPQHCRMLKLHHPILTPDDLARLRRSQTPDVKVGDLECLYDVAAGGSGLDAGLTALFAQAEAAIAAGATILLLSDRKLTAGRAAIPALLAVSGLHHHLIRRGLRTQAGLILETGEAREVIHFAMLIAFGCNAVCPHVAFSTVRDLAAAGLLDKPVSVEVALDHYLAAVKKGLLKTFSRMGISTLRSFFGSQIFEAVGLGPELMNRYFPNTASRIGGIGLAELAADVAARHRTAFPTGGVAPSLLATGGNYHLRAEGEKHLWSADAIFHLQQAVRTDSLESFKKYTREINDQARHHITLRSLLTFTPGAAVPLAEVEPVESIVKRFVASAMSFGSISKEAHETIARAMNRLGAWSNSGEGGEDPARYQREANGDLLKSRVKQVASGRFGVTTEYLINADELQIKVAQGAKPGEGGQLPGHKVSEDIARVRHTTPGVTLISPPPHHDIYSIEDLAQLIYDLKCVNPAARVSVKLVSEVGVGTIASGVAKAKADMVLIAGHDGGTGASPLTAIKHAGLPWELGLAETQQSLRQNGLRDRIRVQVDGQLRTGRDLAIATLLGAEEFGFATVVLVTLGCTMMRKCHLNTCPFGVATQDERLRERFQGKPEHVERFFRFLAGEFREVMAQLGFRTVEEMVGHSERLAFDAGTFAGKPAMLDFRGLLEVVGRNAALPLHCQRNEFREGADCFDDGLLERLRAAIEDKQPVTLDLPIRNINRTVGARLSGAIVGRHGPKGLPPGTIKLNFTGSAGQSLGAFLAPGVAIRVEGDVNDYVGKGMSGGRIVVVPSRDATFAPEDSVIAGNVILYGATSGKLFINGLAGERFAVRNSGATVVVEGVGDHGCEYMTGGVVVVLGPTGVNFAAGMSGGIAYVYDPTGLFDTRCNLDMVDLEPVRVAEDVAQLRTLITRHLELTGSRRARQILENWDTQLAYFVKVMPIDYRLVLERMRQQVHREDETISATEEVYDDGKADRISGDHAAHHVQAAGR